MQVLFQMLICLMRAVQFGVVSGPKVILALTLCALPALGQVSAFDPDAVEDHIAQTLERDRVPGAAVAIVSGTEVLFLKGFGEDGRGQPVDANTAFVLGSMSKAFTALVAMQLIEAGVVALDTPVGPNVPELETSDIAAWNSITLGHLLTHQSGVPTRTPNLPVGASLAQNAEALARVKLVHVPGGQHLYSSGNYLLAARMLETISGTAFDQLLAVQVLAPLGIGHYDTAGSTSDQGRLSAGHQYWFAWPRSVDLPPEPGRLATASMTASAADMARFLQFQLGDGAWGGKRLLSAGGLKKMHRGAAQGDGFTYGLGWRDVELAGVRTVQHGGVLPHFRGKMIMLPDQNAAVLVLTNASSVLPLPVRPTSHRLANDIAMHLAGGPLGTPNLGFRTWLILFWCGLGLIGLHQLATLVRILLGRDPASLPLWSAGADVAMVLGIVFVLPWITRLSLGRILVETPDLALWLVAMAVMALCATALRVRRAMRAACPPT